MMALRSARLEAILDSRLEQVEYAKLLTLISNQVAEAFDLDFKPELYGFADRDKRDAATDVAALARVRMRDHPYFSEVAVRSGGRIPACRTRCPEYAAGILRSSAASARAAPW
jgi:hypothetical protein